MRALTPQLVHCLSALADHRSDGDLLAGFLERRDEDDFLQLIHKYGPMVWGICRRALPDPADAEDAFQTVFLVLLRRGNGLVNLPSIGPWLHRVAVWTARNARRRNARRLAHRVALPETISTAIPNTDLAFDLDAALLSLPEKFRSPIVLCHVLGYSRADAAAQLGCAERTLKLWLARGLEKLRVKLKGLDPAKPLAIAAIALPIGLSETLVQAAISWQSTAIAASLISANISHLLHGVMRMFWIKKATAASLALFTVFALGMGVGVSTRQVAAVVGGDDPAKAPMPQGKPAQSQKQAQSATGIDVAVLERKLSEALDLASMYRAQWQKFDEELRRELRSVSKEDLLNADPDALKKLRECQHQLKTAEQQMEYANKVAGDLKQKLNAVRDARAQDPTKKAPLEKPAANAPIPLDLDKQLQETKQQLNQLQSEAERAMHDSQRTQAEYALRRQELQLKIETFHWKIQELERQKEKQKIRDLITPLAEKSMPGPLQLILSPKGTAWPFQIKEFDAVGKPIGTVAFDNVEVLALYLGRRVKDSSGPKELRIHSSEDATDLMHDAIRAGMAAGLKYSVFDKATGKQLYPEDRLRKDALRDQKQLQLLNELEALLDGERQARLNAEERRHQAELEAKINELKAKLAIYKAKVNPEEFPRQLDMRALTDEIKAKESELEKMMNARRPTKPAEPAGPPKP